MKTHLHFVLENGINRPPNQVVLCKIQDEETENFYGEKRVVLGCFAPDFF